MAEYNGWISVHRKILSHWIWQTNKPFDKRSAWIDILLMVNHRKRKVVLGNELIEVERGERITSERKLAERWGWSRTKVRNFLKLLQKDSMIEVKKPNQKRTRLKVLNYSKYQNIENHKKTREEPEKNQKKTTGEPDENINNNDNNDNNDNKECSDSKSSPNDTVDNSSQPKFGENDKPYNAARFLRYKILQNNRRAQVPDETPEDIENWSIEMDRLHRLGPVGAKESENKGYSWSEIKKIITWCQDHDFWKSNILSAGKLREKIVKLENQMKRDKKFNSNYTSQSKDLSPEKELEELEKQGWR